jgi:hypothetical protein
VKLIDEYSAFQRNRPDLPQGNLWGLSQDELEQLVTAFQLRANGRSAKRTGLTSPLSGRECRFGWLAGVIRAGGSPYGSLKLARPFNASSREVAVRRLLLRLLPTPIFRGALCGGRGNREIPNFLAGFQCRCKPTWLQSPLGLNLANTSDGGSRSTLWNDCVSLLLHCPSIMLVAAES